jgi:hypothetical protein
MPTRASYQQEAKRLFDMALMARDPAVRARWIERANEYLLVADTLRDYPPRLGPESSQPQPMQQQQQKSKDTDE